MTSGHFIFIPMVFSVGMLCGFMLGGRVAQDRLELDKRRDREREAARKARAERTAAAKPDDPEAGG